MRNRILFLSAVWILVLVPAMFWHGPWFGRPLSDQQIDTYLHDQNTQHVQHALSQLGDRMAHKDPSVETWYPDLLTLADSTNEDVRRTDAQIMGEDFTQPVFHSTLLRMLHDDSLAVRNEAALSLVQFGDASGHDEIMAILRPIAISAPIPGRVLEIAKPGTNFPHSGNLAKLESGDRIVEVHSSIAGRVNSIAAQPGQSVESGAELLTLNASTDAIRNALHALASIGRVDDLPAIDFWTSTTPDIPEHVRQEAIFADKSIRERP